MGKEGERLGDMERVEWCGGWRGVEVFHGRVGG